MPDQHSPITLAPEVGEAIKAAIAALEREAKKAELMGDPSAGLLFAQSQMLSAQYRLFVDGTLTFGKLTEEAKHPFKQQGLDKVAKETADAADRYSEERHNQMLGQTYHKNILMLAGILAAGWYALTGAKYGDEFEFIPKSQRMLSDAGRDCSSCPITICLYTEELDAFAPDQVGALARYEELGVARVIVGLNPETSEAILPRSRPLGRVHPTDASLTVYSIL